MPLPSKGFKPDYKKIFKVTEIYNIFKNIKSRNLLILQGIPALLTILSVENGIIE